MRRLFVTGILAVIFFSSLQAQVTSDFSASPVSGCSPLVVNFTDLSTGPVTSWTWNFGNGNTSTLQNPSAVYVNPGQYTVTLTVSDGSNNDTRTYTNLITVFQNPTSFFSATSPVNGCAPLSVSFGDLSTPGDGTINQWLWDFGDGNTDTVQNPTHIYATAGTFTVTLVVTDDNGCSNTFVITNYVNVSNSPVAAFTGGPLNACDPPLTVNFTNNTTGGAAPVTFQWDFGDGNTSTATSPSHTYTTYGNFTVTLIATDNNGCADTLTRTTYVNIETVTADFSLPDDTTCVGQNVAINNLSSPSANSFQWDFGDGNTSTSANPTHSWAAPGSYTITLIANSPAGCADTLVRPAAIFVNPSPIANFGADTTTACVAPLTVNFTDSSTGSPVTWTWDFGDGNTSALQNPTHTYTAPATFTISLTVMSADSCFDTFTRTNYIQIIPPVADFVGLPITGCVPLTVNFTDNSTSVEPIVSWQWDFGDGNTSNAQNPSHTYTAIGAYTVTLIIVNAAGCTDTLVRPTYIQVGDIPIASFTANPLTACVGEQITFTDLSTNANTWFWEFGDGGTSTAQNPTYAYQDTGCFTVRLTVSNNGCIDDTVITNYICISPPLAQFNLNPAVGCAIPHTVFFTDQSILPDTWFWDFGDGNTSTAQNPVHTYTSPGNFTVTLTVTDTITGCVDDATATVNISIPQADFTGAPLFGCGPLTVNFTDNSSGFAAPVTYAWDFGDGGTSTAQNPVHIYNTPGVYTVSLTITDANGCTSTRTRSNYVQVIGPDVNFGGTPTAGCAPLTVSFSDSTNFGAPITSWSWDFGDGATSNLQNPTHTYLNPGTYDVSLTVTDLDGCSRTFTQPNFVFVTQPQAGFSASDTIACLGVTIDFTDTSSGIGLSWLWDFGDGNTSTAQNPSHTYAANGNYTVTLVVTDVNGCTDTASVPGFVEIRPVAAGFLANPTNASCPPLLVSFTDTSSFGIVSWEWDFGDGTGSTLQNPGHVYSTAGSFDVQLIVVNNQGCTDTLLIPGLVNIQGPSGTFTFAPDSGCTPTDVIFMATTTNTVQRTWDFGDGNVVVAGDTVIHTYTQTGTFFPLVILDDGLGCTFTVTTPDSIVIDTIPFPDFTTSQNIICGPDSVFFTDQTVSTRPLVSWDWDFGDGGTDTVQNPAHFYAAPGIYTVTLVVTNSLGCVDSIIKPAEVIIAAPPIAAIAATDTVGCDPLFVQFGDSTVYAAPAATWAWDFGNGSTNTAQHPSSTFSGTGFYTVELIVTDSIGCADTTTQVVEVRPGPTANFAANDSVGCPPFPVTFTGNGGMGINLWAWSFGDGGLDSGQVVSHTYQNSGTYTVQLIVEDTLGCRDTIVRPNYIRISPPVADFAADVTSGCAPLIVTFSDSTQSDTTLVSWDWDFGDGNTGTGTPVTHTYSTPGVYSVTLIVTDVVGCMDTIVRPNYITVFEPPQAGFFILDTIACDPFTIELQDTSTGVVALTSWQWDFGDGGTSVQQNPVHAYAAGPGTYTITLIVTDANGCSDTATMLFTVPVRPLANFIITDSVGCAPFATVFTADSVDIVSWTWNFGDGGGDTIGGPVVSHTYPNRGRYDVSLIIEDIYGCFDTLIRRDLVFVDSLVAGFTADLSVGCPPLVVQFTDTTQTDTSIASWQWNFGDGSTSNQQNPAHTYNTSGSYTVSLVVTNALGCTDTATFGPIEVYDVTPPPVPPIYMVTVLNETQDSISWQQYSDPDFSHYVLYRENPTGSGVYVPVDSFFNVNDTFFVDNGLTTLNLSYCYRLQVVDICGIRSVLSDQHCTINLEAFPGINQANLSWSAYIGWDSIAQYNVYRVTDWDPATASLIGTVPGTVTTFNDTNVVCYERYCYRIQAIEAGGFQQVSWSDTSCATPIYFPNELPAYLCTATVEADQNVLVAWTNVPVPNVQEFYLEKSTNGNNWTLIATLPPTAVDYLDTDVDVHSQYYFYRISFLDSCGDLSPWSNVGRTILLEGETVNVPVLEWTPYEEWDFGVFEYELEVFNELSQLWEPVDVFAENILKYEDRRTQIDQVEYCYRLRGIERNGACRSLSNTACVPVGPLIFAPNAFTPNGDGTNDDYIVKGWFVAEYNIQIFDRWGKLLFESNSMDVSWDGRFNGNDCQEGAYVWVITGRGYDDTPIQFTGTVTLYR